MSQIDAIYRRGVFQPIGPVDLPEEQRVRLNVEPAEVTSVEGWLERVRQRQTEILRRRGPLPDSSTDIAEDRLR